MERERERMNLRDEAEIQTGACRVLIVRRVQNKEKRGQSVLKSYKHSVPYASSGKSRQLIGHFRHISSLSARRLAGEPIKNLRAVWPVRSKRGDR